MDHHFLTEDLDQLDAELDALKAKLRARVDTKIEQAQTQVLAAFAGIGPTPRGAKTPARRRRGKGGK